MKTIGYVHQLKARSEKSEIWWDSSPTVLRAFRQRLQAKYPAMQHYISELLPEKFEDKTGGYTGATTNPRLVTAAILSNKNYWSQVASKYANQMSPGQLHQKLYNKAIGDGANIIKPLWEESKGRYGWLSAQVDPTYIQSSSRMIDQGVELAGKGPNIMIKIPGSAAGYSAIHKLVALGYSINNTFCYTVSQFGSCLSAIKNGRHEARIKGVDTSSATYVITFMIGRFSSQPEIDIQALERDISLSACDKRWAEIAIYNEIQVLIAQSKLPVRILLSSIKIDQNSEGLTTSWHLEKTGGSTTVFTMTPEVFEFLVHRENVGRPVSPNDSEIPKNVLDKLLKIPYFYEAFFDGAIDPHDYSSHPAFISTCAEAMEAHRRLRDFASLHCSNLFSILPKLGVGSSALQGAAI